MDFPSACRLVANAGGFPFKAHSSPRGNNTRLPLSPHPNPCFACYQQSRRFPQQLLKFLASFANMVSYGDNSGTLADEREIWSVIHHAHARQATLPTALFDENRKAGLILSRTHHCACFTTFQQVWAQAKVSTKKGSCSACHCSTPLILNSQHQPSIGHRKPAPETSSMCPSTVF